MKNIKYFIFTLFLFALSFLDVSAAVCDSNDIARLKEVAKNVTVTYEYDQEAEDDTESYGSFIGTVNGLMEDIYVIFESDVSQVRFYYNNRETFSNEVHSGENNVYILALCDDTVLKKEKLTIPYYNVYSSYEECNEMVEDELYVCNKFLDKEISYSTFLSQIKKYNSSNFNDFDDNQTNFIELLKKYYYVIILVVVILVVGFILFLRNLLNKRRLD